MGPGSLPRASSGRGVALTTHSHLEPSVKKQYSYISTPLCAFIAGFSVTFTFTISCWLYSADYAAGNVKRCGVKSMKSGQSRAIQSVLFVPLSKWPPFRNSVFLSSFFCNENYSQIFTYHQFISWRTVFDTTMQHHLQQVYRTLMKWSLLMTLKD